MYVYKSLVWASLLPELKVNCSMFQTLFSAMIEGIRVGDTFSYLQQGYGRMFKNFFSRDTRVLLCIGVVGHIEFYSLTYFMIWIVI